MILINKFLIIFFVVKAYLWTIFPLNIDNFIILKFIFYNIHIVKFNIGFKFFFFFKLVYLEYKINKK